MLDKKFDGEFPDRYNDVMSFLDLEPTYFHELCDEARSPHLWCKEYGEWNYVIRLHDGALRSLSERIMARLV